MANIPIAQEYGVKYTLVGPDGTIAVLNDPTNLNYVGMISELTGLDSPEVRESAQDIVEGDGGVHGSFYFSRRPMTMTVRVFGHASMSERSTRIDRLRRASLAMRNDANLLWTPSTPGAEPVFIPVRRQQPFRESGNWIKDLQLSLVSEFAVIMSQALYVTPNTASGTGVTVENKGNYQTYPIIQITGVSSNPQVSDGHGGVFKTGPSGNTLTLASGEKVEFDMLNHSGVFTAGARVGQSANRYIDFGNTTQWPCIRPSGSSPPVPGGVTTNIERWFKPETMPSGTIQAWGDASANQVAAVQATGANQPLQVTNQLDGYPIARFDGSNDSLSTTHTADASATYFIVAKQAANVASRGALGWGDGNRRLGNSSGASQWGYSNNEALAAVTLGGTTTNWTLLTLRVNSAASADGYVNGGAATNFDPNDGITAATSIYLGQAGNGSFWNGDIAEVLAYTDALTLTDIDSVRGYFSAKYPTLGTFGTAPSSFVGETFTLTGGGTMTVKWRNTWV